MAVAPLHADAKPRLRRYLSASDNHGEIVIRDPRRIGRALGVTRLGLEILKRFDGTRTLPEVQEDLLAITGGSIVPLELLEKLAATLEEHSLLDSTQFRTRFEEPIRPSSHFPPNVDRAVIGKQIQSLFTDPGGAGLPGKEYKASESNGRWRAVLLPHMDYRRGNVTYGHGFKELIESTEARTFVVVATSHYSHHRFTLSRQHFATPFGTVETDLDYVDRIAAAYGSGLFDDVEAHLPEHSIELEVVPLKFLKGERPFRIVPLLVGSFHDCIAAKNDPSQAADICRMVRVLREVEAASSEPVCYIISGDLAHIGPKFNDARKAEGPWLVESKAKDEAILKTFSQADPKAYFETISAEGDARRICGLPPTWLTLEVSRPKAGKLLHYQQYVDPTGFESVSFAAAAFYG